jgi:hypothetical protein
MWSKPTSSVSLTDKFRKRSIKLQRAFQILTKPEAIEFDCYKARGLFFPNSSVMPLEGEKFSLDFPYAFADSFSLSRQSLVLWQMNVDYTGELGPGDKEDNPLFTPPRVDWDDVETEEEIDEDWDGKPIQTVNGEPIEGVKTLLPDQTVSIKRNMLLFNPFIQARYRRSGQQRFVPRMASGDGQANEAIGVQRRHSRASVLGSDRADSIQVSIPHNQ